MKKIWEQYKKQQKKRKAGRISTYGQPSLLQRLLNPTPKGWITLGIPLARYDGHEEEQ